MVADLDTGAVLAACNAHVPLRREHTKILTALALHPRLPRATRYVARPEDAAIDGTKVGLSPGSTYSADDLWHGLLIGQRERHGQCARRPRGRRAQGCRAHDQHGAVTRRSGHRRRHHQRPRRSRPVSSAYDLALFGRALLRDPALAALVRTRLYAFPSKHVRGKARATYQIANHNLLLSRYPGDDRGQERLHHGCGGLAW